VAQLKSQDPLEPVNNQEFMSQLAQFSTLEGIEKLNTNFADMLSLQQITQGAGLIGKNVSYSTPDSATVTQGRVDGFAVASGRLQLQVGGTSVPISQVLGMSSAA
ncbi:MAG: flagellar hook capping protein, partial [Planctomycetales bacterium]|nr:flagellar hook capping protein [Planctomycetales bacterium]